MNFRSAFFYEGFVFFLICYLCVIPIDTYAYKVKNVDLHLNTGVKEIYDDNITYVKESRKTGFSSTLFLGFDAEYESKLTSLNASGNIYHQMFNHYEKYNNTSQDFSLDFKNELSSRMRIEVNDKFLHAYEPRSFEQAFAAIPGRYSYFQNNFDTAFNLDINKRLTGKIRYSNDLDAFTRQDLSNSYLNKAGLGLEYIFSKLTKLLASYDFAHRSFHPGKSVPAHILTGGIKTELNKKLSLEANAGVNLGEAFDDSNYAEPHASIILSQTIDPKLTGTFAFTKEYSTTPYTQDMFDYWQLYGVLNRQVSKKFGVSLSAFYGEGKYILLDIHDRFRGANVDLIYDFSETLKATLGYGYSQADSDLDSREYKKNTISLALAFKF